MAARFIMLEIMKDILQANEYFNSSLLFECYYDHFTFISTPCLIILFIDHFLETYPKTCIVKFKFFLV